MTLRHRPRPTDTLFKCFLLALAAVFVMLIVIGFKELIGKAEDFELPVTEDNEPHVANDGIKVPIILWWTPFTHDQGQVKSCGDHQCFFTINRKYKNHPLLKVFLFYGSNLEVGDLPLPRKQNHQWGLLHEESPKNNRYIFCHEEFMRLFNHTSTFKRESDCPLTTLYLDDVRTLESNQHLVSVEKKNQLMRDEGLAMINYVHSDCDPPSDRDTFVRMLQRHLKVDSYGRCLHNKELPEHLKDPIAGMDHHDFYQITAKYKFTLAMENAVCDDYITEKFWRPFIAGSVPIVYGSPKIKDWLPDEKSAIVIKDFDKVEDIVQLLLHLNSSDTAYEKYLEFKSKGVTNKLLQETMTNRKWGTNNDRTKPNFVTNFECCVCERLHEQLKHLEEGVQIKHQASVDHYGCPIPTQFADEPLGSLKQKDGSQWAHEWIRATYRSKAIAQLISENRRFSETDVEKRANILQYT